MFFRSTSKFVAKPFVLLAIVWTTLGWAPSASWAAAGADDAQSIVERADLIRFPRADYEIDVRIVTEGTGQSAAPGGCSLLSQPEEAVSLSDLDSTL